MLTCLPFWHQNLPILENVVNASLHKCCFCVAHYTHCPTPTHVLAAPTLTWWSIACGKFGLLFLPTICLLIGTSIVLSSKIEHHQHCANLHYAPNHQAPQPNQLTFLISENYHKYFQGKAKSIVNSCSVASQPAGPAEIIINKGLQYWIITPLNRAFAFYINHRWIRVTFSFKWNLVTKPCKTSKAYRFMVNSWFVRIVRQ